MSVSLNLGARLPAAVTSMGRVLLARLPPEEARGRLRSCRHRAYIKVDRDRLWVIVEALRAQGWCLVDDELEEGLRSLAVPLRGKSGRVVAAMNVSASSKRVSAAEMRRVHLPLLLDAADEIARSLIG